MRTPSLRLLAALLLTPAFVLSAQKPTRADSTARMVKLAPVGVTATRWESSVFRTATPLLVIDSSTVRNELPNGVGDLFRNQNLVGPNRCRP